ncbi:helix-turn-helix domain-containing protein [Streptomyces anulatus]|uniref:helix-turn-helix domain-containing protein n=1 Tax=Streptomyces anulatus TaxID=1892 RepID=UPI0032541966
MHRLARTGGTAELLRWLAGRAAGWAGIVGPDGTVLHAAARTARAVVPDVAALVAEVASALTERGAQAYSLDTGAHTTLLFPLSADDRAAPVLAVITPRPVAVGLATLLADVVLPLSVCRRAETLVRERRRVDLAESRGREAVLHLLMTGQLSIAQQVAGALRPRLPDPVRVCVVECSGDGRDEVARVCADADGGRSWIVRCPVYARHLILVMPARLPEEAEPGPAPTDETVAARVGDCTVGVSEPVPLADTATGYRQAFHALAVARELPSRHARFGVSPDPALVVGPAGRQWAHDLLTPLLTHVPRRAQDPGAQELAATAASWLAFSSHATDHLKVHRNTLAARLRLIGELLGLDLHRLADQAALDLALRVRAAPAPACTPEPAPYTPTGSGTREGMRGLDEILGRPAVRHWADQQLAPVLGSEETLRTWLRCEGRLGPAAAELGISVPGARKRLTRLETLLRRSLLRPPSARYDLWLALRSRDLAAGGG